MTSNQKTNYFAIGMFILVGMFLIIVTIIIFGSKSLLKQAVYVETYFNESVQGLSKGSAVKYLGMDIGQVEDIATVEGIYDGGKNNLLRDGGKYIYVKMAVSPRFFHAPFNMKLEDVVRQDVAKGLRVKLALQGLTGNAYLELDYVNPQTRVLPISWKPANYYIPSMTSTLAYFSDNVQYLLSELRSIDIKKVVDSFEQLINSTNKTVSTFDQTATSANQLLQNTNHQMYDVMANFRVISQNIRAVSEHAKAHPAAVLFGKPPKRVDLNRLGRP
jgi:ABC-type transporter Mla subunit MlaD